MLSSDSNGALERGAKANESPKATPAPVKADNSIINQGPPFVSEDQVRQAIKSGQRLIILDVRERSAFAKSHLTGAKNMTLDEIEVRAANELSVEDLIVLYCGCKDDAASKVSQKILSSQGFHRITILHDGTEDCETCN